MRISVVISTLHRADGLRLTLEALRFQRHRDFEVIVVEGPSEIGWGQVRNEQHDWVRRVRSEQTNVAHSRNLGVAHAGGEILAFIDDDAVPEPRWLADLADAYKEERLQGAGGVVLDRTGLRPQYAYSCCDRLGRTRFDRSPSPQETLPGADPFLYLQGTNMSFRHDTLLALGGFDEHLAYVYDDVDIALRLIDSGGRLRHIDGAVVHHHSLPNPARKADGSISDPFTLAEGRAYFALRHGPSSEEVQISLRELSEELSTQANRAAPASEAELEHFKARTEEGLRSGARRAQVGPLTSTQLRAQGDPNTIAPYPLLTEEHPLRLCMLAPEPNEERLAFELAAAGEEVHLLTRTAREMSHVVFDGHLWTHRLQSQDRRLPALEGNPLAADIYTAAAHFHEVQRLHNQQPVGLVLAGEGSAESLICVLDRRWPTLTTLPREPLRGEPGGPAVSVEELARVLLDRAGLTPQAAHEVAGELLDPGGYPIDLAAAVLAAWDAPAEEFADAVFLAALGRRADPGTRASWREHIAAGHSRHELLSGVLASAEAHQRGVPRDMLESFQRRLAARAPLELQRAWTLPDGDFTAVAYQWILGRSPDPEYGRRAISDLQGGASRLDIVARLVTSVEAGHRGMLPDETLRALRQMPTPATTCASAS